ncbi:MAG: hypothetical protein K2G12_05235, partial [Prevotella sp.]|nr:hypothetical protein [Prevotella sp.]
MALWRIVVKTGGNATYNDRRQCLAKGMSVTASTVPATQPLGLSREQMSLARLFMDKYGIGIYSRKMSRSDFYCIK